MYQVYILYSIILIMGIILTKFAYVQFKKSSKDLQEYVNIAGLSLGVNMVYVSVYWLTTVTINFVMRWLQNGL